MKELKDLRGLFESLAFAAKVEDFADVANSLQLLLRCMETNSKDSMRCSEHDKRLIELFWRRLLNNFDRRKSVLDSATAVYGIMEGAKYYPLHRLSTLAGVHCQAISLLCTDLAANATYEYEPFTVRHLRVYTGGGRR